MINVNNPDYYNTPVSSQRPLFHYKQHDPGAIPCFTLVTPFYNVGTVFHETARSVLQQSFQQWEWLIINDGSTDPDSISMLNGYRNMDPRIRVIDQDFKQGPGAARNIGFKNARTPFVLPLNGDDLLEPTAAEKWLWFLTTHPEYAFVNSYAVGFGAKQYLWQKGAHSGKAILNENIFAVTCLFRKEVFLKIGGYDESNQDGLEDWDFWLHCANEGYWGYTIPEYLFWDRCGPNQNNHPDNRNVKSFLVIMRQRYSRLWRGHFPSLKKPPKNDFAAISNEISFQNRLSSNGKRRLLMILPWMTLGGADKFNLDLVQQLTQKDWEVTIATTLNNPPNSWDHEFSRYTADIFALPEFLQTITHPGFLSYLVHSRQPEIVLVSNSELGYLTLPYLRSQCPEVTFIDYCHAEEENVKNGGYPGYSNNYQECLDLSLVTSCHLKDWMVERGGNSERIEVCYVDIDSEKWKPNERLKSTIKKQLDIPADTAIILYAARLYPGKQPQVFARVMYNLRQSGLKFVSLVAGDGEDRPWLEKYLSKNSLSAFVKMLGPVSSERMSELMVAADIFFLPSKSEGIALTIYEAMASGVAVVGSDVGGQKELVTQDCGILLPVGDEVTDVKNYTRILSRLLENPAERLKMGNQARTRIENNFRLELMGQRILDLFAQAHQRHALLSSVAMRDNSNILEDPAFIDYVKYLSGPGDDSVEIPAELKGRIKLLYQQPRFRNTIKLIGRLHLKQIIPAEIIPVENTLSGEDNIPRYVTTRQKTGLNHLYQKRWFRIALDLFFKTKLNKLFFGG
jgi:glycosyltransferase involved in cell wall biosynthesis/GT2 family glycosyltransferase